VERARHRAGRLHAFGDRQRWSSFLSADLKCIPRSHLCTSCVQEGGFEGPENGPKQRRINNRLLSYRPQHRRGNVHNYRIVRWFSVFRNCAEFALRYKTATSPVHLLWTLSESEFRLSRRVQSAQRQDVLAQPGSAVFWRTSDQQTEPQCGSSKINS
jgi:hypothetical protein